MNKGKNFVFSILSFGLLFCIGSCKTPARQSADVKTDLRPGELWKLFKPEVPKKLEMCAAIRGNGNYIFAHWGAMAQALEHYGPIDAVAGGSSGSATAFLYESVYLNPAVWKCARGQRDCTEKERAERMAFLMKSMREFINVMGARANFGATVSAVTKVIQRVKDSEYLAAILARDFSRAAYRLISILRSDEIGGIIDQRIVTRLEAALSDPPELERQVLEIQSAIASLSWTATNNVILFQRGLIDFEALAARVGIAGDFYAGRDIIALQKTIELLDSCSDKAVGKHWSEIDHLEGPWTGKTIQSYNPLGSNGFETKKYECGEFYREAMNQYLDRFYAANKPPQRLNDVIGNGIPGIVSTAVYEAQPAKDRLSVIYNQYRNGAKYKASLETNWLRFGYWGSETDLQTIKENKQNFTDIKTKRFYPLGAAQWGEILRVSPQEPGLGSILCNYELGTADHRGKWDTYSNLPQGTPCHRWSLGGWIDMYPIQALKNLGCERVVYLTRQDDESTFVTGVAKLLSLNDEDWLPFEKQLYDLDNPESAAAKALDSNSASLCSDWDMIQSVEIDCLGENAYTSPIQSKDEFFTSLAGEGARGERLRAAGFVPFKNVSASEPLRGCFSGAPKPAKEAVRPSPCKKAEAGEVKK